MTHQRIYVVDPDARRRAGLCRELLSLGCYASPFESLDEIQTSWPSEGLLLVWDQGGTVEQVSKCMEAANAWLPVICYGETAEPAVIVQAIKAGAIDFLRWPASLQELEEAIAAPVESTSQLIEQQRLKADARRRTQALSRREGQVLTMVARGFSSKMIAEDLSISPRTVEIHRANMLGKLDVAHTAEAIGIAIRAAIP